MKACSNSPQVQLCQELPAGAGPQPWLASRRVRGEALAQGTAFGQKSSLSICCPRVGDHFHVSGISSPSFLPPCQRWLSLPSCSPAGGVAPRVLTLPSCLGPRSSSGTAVVDSGLASDSTNMSSDYLTLLENLV